MNYGIANQSGQVASDEARSIVERSYSSGFDILDTAMSYGDSEQRLGQIGVNDWRIVTKLPAVPADCGDIPHWVATAVEESLHRLKTGKLYGLLLHRPQQLLEKMGDQLYLALQDLKRDGRVQKIGISIYDPSELAGILDRYTIDLVQSPFNVLDRRLIETGWLQKLSEQGTELHVRSVFLQGLLLMKPGDRPLKFSRWSQLWARWDEWLDHCGLTPVQACLRYALSFQQISKVIVGVDSLQQMNAIISASVGPSPKVPDDICTSEVELLSPTNWN
jgi:aryl-alcohol dehydrogenase-like predicted oxidoreductase